MRPIAEGKSVALMAPTGTGKTLAYLLPLLQRLQGKAFSSEGPKLLVICPSEDLQQQVGFVARVLGGPRMAEAVLVLSRGATRSEMATALVVVATPALLMEKVGQPDFIEVWEDAMASIEALVVDEADSLLPMGGARTWVLGDLLDDIMDARRRQQADSGEDSPLQVVAVSASIDTNTLNLLEDTVGVPIELYRGGASGDVSEGTQGVEDPDDPDAVELWPKGLRHSFSIRERLLERGGAVSPYALGTIAAAVKELKPTCCLVILAEKRKLSERGGSLGRYLTRLRKELPSFQVVTASAAVQGLVAGGPAQPGQQRLILGRSESIRGLDIPGVDTVIIVGALATAREYLHLAGRTARCAAGADAPTQGTVCSLVGSINAKTLKKWGREMGFEPNRLWLDDPSREGAAEGGRPGGKGFGRGSGKGSGKGRRSEPRDPRTSVYDNIRI